MLRLIVLILILLNSAYFAWGQGWLLPYGMGPTQQHEPQRLTQQIRPEALVVINDKAAAPASTAASTAASPATSTTASAVGPRAGQCLQTGVMDETQANALRRVLAAALPESAWTLDGLVTPERWIVYMGKYANAADLAKKRAQLASLRLNFEPLVNPELALGLSLGAYKSQDAANAALEALALRGVRTARVLQETPASKGYRLRLPAVDDTVQKQLAPVRAALSKQTLEPCPAPTPAPQ